MNTQKHTDGPWHITKEEKFLTMGTFITVRDSHEGVIAGTHVDDEANARLIATAPDLLEEARLSITYLELSLKAHDYLTTLEHERLVRLRALLAKAEGVK